MKEPFQGIGILAIYGIQMQTSSGFEFKVSGCGLCVYPMRCQNVSFVCGGIHVAD